MTVYYKKRRGIIFLLSGILLVLARLFLLSLKEGNTWMFIPSILIAVIGFLYLQAPYFELRPNELVVFTLVGTIAKRYPYTQLSDFSLEGKKIYLHHQDKKRRVWVSGMVAATEQWEWFIDHLTGHDLTRELHNI